MPPERLGGPAAMPGGLNAGERAALATFSAWEPAELGCCSARHAVHAASPRKGSQRHAGVGSAPLRHPAGSLALGPGEHQRTPGVGVPLCARVCTAAARRIGCCWVGLVAILAYVAAAGQLKDPLGSEAGFVKFFVAGVALSLVTAFNVATTLEVESHPANKAAFRLFRFWERHPGRSGDLPEKLRGVFWMSDTAFPQLLVCAENMDVDLHQGTSTLWGPSRFNWSFCDNRRGWFFYLCSRLLGINALVFRWDSEWEEAILRPWLLGFIPPVMCDLFLKISVRQLDDEGDSWACDITAPRWAARPSLHLSFTLVKVVDADGFELPGFGAMMRTIMEEHTIKESIVKSMSQFIPTG